MAYSRWLADWWEEQAEVRQEVTPELREGLSAYAKKQATAERTLAQRWETKHRPVRARAEEFLSTTFLSSALELKKLEGSAEAASGAQEESNSGDTTLPLDLDFLELTLEDPTDDFEPDEYD